MNNNEIYKPFAEFAKQIIEAKDIAFRKHIKANAIIINDNFLDVPKWQEYSRGVCGQSNCVDYPEMICGLEAHHTKVALPDNILFAVCEVQETYHDRIRREIAHQVRKETAKEILNMLYDMGIDKEILECCRIYDVDGVSLAKQIYEKYSVEVEEMNKDEIKKALETCAQDSLDCGSCCYSDNYTNCVMRLKYDAIKLITEQENDIELLKMQMKDVVNHADTFLAEEQKFEAENVKLKAENEDLKDEIIYLERKIAIRDNALKDRDKAIEMLEGKQDAIVKRAKIDMLNEAKKCSCCDNFFPDGQWHRFIFVSDIDILIKRVENDR